MARILAQKLSELWASGSSSRTSRRRRLDRHGLRGAQPADGYSFVIGNLGPVVVNPLLSKVPFDVERDFLPVSLIATGPNVLVVNPKTPAKTLGELIAYARANPGKLNSARVAPAASRISPARCSRAWRGRHRARAVQGCILSVNDLIAGTCRSCFRRAAGACSIFAPARCARWRITSPERSPLVPDVRRASSRACPGSSP